MAGAASVANCAPYLKIWVTNASLGAVCIAFSRFDSSRLHPLTPEVQLKGHVCQQHAPMSNGSEARCQGRSLLWAVSAGECSTMPSAAACERVRSSRISDTGWDPTLSPLQAGFMLGQVTADHPGMKPIVVRETEAFIFRPGLQERARYYAVVFLNQLVLSRNPAHGTAPSVSSFRT